MEQENYLLDPEVIRKAHKELLTAKKLTPKGVVPDRTSRINGLYLYYKVTGIHNLPGNKKRELQKMTNEEIERKISQIIDKI